MIRRLTAGTKRLFGLHHPGRNLRIFPDDVFLVSYPKSGNTWTRFLIANLVYPERQPDFANINELVPDPEALSKRHLERLPRPRILKSHQYFDPRYRRMICIVRDPRDVVLSEYHFGIKRRVVSDDYPLEQFVNLFIHGEVDHPYGSWGENVASWFYTRRHDPGFLLVRYEALQSQAMEQMERIAGFLHLSPDPQRFSFAIAQSSASRMRELEKQQAHLWSSTRETRPDRPFVRKATAGGWKSELPQACIARIESAWGGLMEDLGYELTVPKTVNQS